MIFTHPFIHAQTGFFEGGRNRMANWAPMRIDSAI
jgi:hypothetical protein